MDAFDGEVRLFGEFFYFVGGDLTQLGPCAAHRKLHLQPGPVLGLLGPDRPYLRQGVAFDQLSLQPRCQFGVGEGEDLGGQNACVGGAVDGHGGYGDARGHLDGGEEGVEAAQGAGGYGDADNRQVSPRRDGAREVGCHAGRADNYLEAAFARRACVLGDAFRVAVGGADLQLVLDAVAVEAGGALFEDGEVGLAADQDTYARVQRSSSSIASRAISVRYCMPSKWICSTAAYARARASMIVGPVPTTSRTLPPAVKKRLSRSSVAAW